MRGVMSSPQPACPAAADEVAEAFVRKTLSPDRAASFKIHIVSCSDCAKEVEITGAFGLAMRGALRAQLRTRGRQC